RRFQIRRAADAATLARARVDYVCINLGSGRATRMPEVFARAYVVTAALPPRGAGGKKAAGDSCPIKLKLKRANSCGLLMLRLTTPGKLPLRWVRSVRIEA